VKVTPELLTALGEKSRQRLATLPEFDFLGRNIVRFKEFDNRKDISVNETERRKERDEDKAFRNKMEDWRDKMKAESSFKRGSILLGLSEEKNKTHQVQLHEGVLPNGRPRANNFYQKIYYYEDGKGDIHSVNVETFNFESALRKSADVAAAMQKSLGREVKADTATEILRRFRNSDPGSNFNVEATFKEFMPELTQQEQDKLLPDFFKELVQIDPEVLEQDERFDIDLREAARVCVDWLTILQGSVAK
jgi:hypothetical protein